MTFSVRHRAEMLRRLQHETFDLCIIGGGITGAGIALDAVTRGMKVALIEKGDFASGTSGKSTKLIHGGLRYLKQFEFGLVKEVGQERSILHRLAPHLVVPEKMILPLVKDGSLGKTMTSIGLYIYDYLAEVQDDDRRRMLDKDELLSLEPLLPSEKLLGGSIYAEYRTDDARLTIEVIKAAHRHGALPINYVTCIGFLEKEGLLEGVYGQDLLSEKEMSIRARHIVNATGPWVDDLRSLNDTVKGKRLYLTKGVHIVIDRQRLPLQYSLYFDVPMDDRMIFAIPRLDVIYIGTTDTYYDGDIDDVGVTKEDLDYLLNTINLTFTGYGINRSDILSSWAGIRPLIYEDGKSASEISRKDEIFTAKNGLISIAGGKLTGYRKMAERVVDLVAKRWSGPLQECRTDKIPLTDPYFTNQKEVASFLIALESTVKRLDLPSVYATYLLQNYGKAADKIIRETAKSSNGHPEEALIRAEMEFCLAHEMMIFPSDFVARRTGRLYFMPHTVSAVRDIIFGYYRDQGLLSAKYIETEQNKWEDMVKATSDFA